MKFYLRIFLALLTFSMLNTMAEARRGGGVGSATSILKIADLPDLEQLQIRGETGMLGYKHEKLSIFWLPLYGSTYGSYVLYIDKGNGWTYRELNQEQADLLHKAAGLSVPIGSPVSRLSLFWGWFVVAPLVLFALMKKRTQSNNNGGSSSAQQKAIYQRQISQALMQAQTQPQHQTMASPQPAQRTSFANPRNQGGFGNRRAN